MSLQKNVLKVALNANCTNKSTGFKTEAEQWLELSALRFTSLCGVFLCGLCVFSPPTDQKRTWLGSTGNFILSRWRLTLCGLFTAHQLLQVRLRDDSTAQPAQLLRHACLQRGWISFQLELCAFFGQSFFFKEVKTIRSFDWLY